MTRPPHIIPSRQFSCCWVKSRFLRPAATPITSKQHACCAREPVTQRIAVPKCSGAKLSPSLGSRHLWMSCLIRPSNVRDPNIKRNDVGSYKNLMFRTFSWAGHVFHHVSHYSSLISKSNFILKFCQNDKNDQYSGHNIVIMELFAGLLLKCRRSLLYLRCSTQRATCGRSALKVLRNKWVFVCWSTSSCKNEKRNFCIKFDVSAGRSCESEMLLSSSRFHWKLSSLLAAVCLYPSHTEGETWEMRFLDVNEYTAVE